MIFPKYLPFPPRLARMSRDAATLDYEARKAANPSYPFPAAWTVEDVAVYQTADGQVHACFDAFKPFYPAGAEPGIGDVRFEMHMSRRAALDFTPASELLSGLGPWANPAIAIAGVAGEVRFIIAASEADLDDHIPADAGRILRPIVVLASDLEDEAPECAFHIGLEVDRKIVVGSRDDVVAYIQNEFSLLMTPEDLSADDVMDRLKARMMALNRKGDFSYATTGNSAYVKIEKERELQPEM